MDGPPPTGQVKVLKLLGRHLGMFTNRIEIPGSPDAINITFRRMEEEGADHSKLAWHMIGRSGAPR